MVHVGIDSPSFFTHSLTLTSPPSPPLPLPHIPFQIMLCYMNKLRKHNSEMDLVMEFGKSNIMPNGFAI